MRVYFIRDREGRLVAQPDSNEPLEFTSKNRAKRMRNALNREMAGEAHYFVTPKVRLHGAAAT